MNLLVSSPPDLALRARLRWPLPALLAWVAGWGLLLAAQSFGLPGWLALALAWFPSGALAMVCTGRWRRLIVLAGLPFALALSGSAIHVAGWVWLAAALCIVAVYPVSAWRDAPMFPTPAHALTGIASKLQLPMGVRILDAGSGLGHGLRALHRAFPGARITGVERSAALLALGRLIPGTPAAQRGDMWATDWSGHDVVYLFQRPETMPRAWEKACAEMRAGAWLISLEFEVPHRRPDLICAARSGRPRPVLAYRIPPRPMAGHACGRSAIPAQ